MKEHNEVKVLKVDRFGNTRDKACLKHIFFDGPDGKEEWMRSYSGVGVRWYVWCPIAEAYVYKGDASRDTCKPIAVRRELAYREHKEANGQR